MSRRYKSAFAYIITLELLKDSKTNESRNVTDRNYAKFRTNKAKVISIEHCITKKKFKSVRSKTTKFFRYQVGNIVHVPDYSSDINEICAPGIHYYITYDAAYQQAIASYNYIDYETPFEDSSSSVTLSQTHYVRYTGPLNDYFNDGTVQSKCNYKNGKLSGICSFYFPNGDIKRTCYYSDDNILTECVFYGPSGNVIWKWSLNEDIC